MFEKYGEFDSAEELNAKAKELLESGDGQQILELAEENGIEKEEAEDYIDGYTPEFANTLMAAQGKLNVESEHLELKGVLTDWKDAVAQMCIDDKELRVAVRKKGKSLKECIAKIIEFSFDKKEPVSKEILAETWVNHNGKREKFKGDLYLGFPNAAETKKLVKKYYLEVQE